MMKGKLSTGLGLMGAGILVFWLIGREASDTQTVQPHRLASISNPAVVGSWFETTTLDLGEELEGNTVVGRFMFRNPHEEPHQLKQIERSCTCSKVTVHVGSRSYTVEYACESSAIYLIKGPGVITKQPVQYITIGPAEPGNVEVHMELQQSGPKDASVRMRTSDEDLPLVDLRFHAVALPYFNIQPPEVNLSTMQWHERREFSCQISSPIHSNFEITGHDALPAGMSIEYRKETSSGRTTWVLTGTYGPNLPPSSSGGIVNLTTNVDRTVSIPVLARVQDVIRINPGNYLALGRVKRSTGVSRIVELMAIDDFDLQVEDVELQDLTVPEQFVRITVSREAGTTRLEINILPDIPGRVVRGTILLHLNHPMSKMRKVQFSGIIEL